MTLDLIIHGGYVITMEGPGTGIINRGAVGIKGNKIVAVGEEQDVMSRYTAHRYIAAKGKAVMPGFVNVHMHTGDAIVRSCAQDLPGKIWRFKGILPLLGVARDEDFAAASRLNIVEALHSGITTFGDYYSPMTEIVKNHIQLGTRAVVSGMINELPPDVSVVEVDQLIPLDPAVGQRKLADNRKLVQEYHESFGGRITCRYGPHSAAMCSEEMLREIKHLADQDGVGIFTHLVQTKEEVTQTRLRTGKAPVALLESLGYLNKKLLAAHMTYASLDEVELVARSGAALALCSTSISVVRGALPPAQEFAGFGGCVGLGTDQACNCTNMFDEMKYAALIHKYKNHDATIFPSWKILRMATIEAARALCMEDTIGSLREGKLADLIILDLSGPQMNPIYERPIRNLVPNLVYSALGNEVESVMIDGNFVIENGRLTTGDEGAIISAVNRAAARISEEMENLPWTAGLPLAQWTRDGYY